MARSYGLDIFDVQFRRESVGLVLRVIIDRSTSAPKMADGPGGEDGISIEDCQRVSQDLSALLDVEEDGGVEGQSYTLEVSSPGLDRPLRHEADYCRFRGRLAKLVTAEPVDGQSAFSGRIAGVENGVVLLTEGRRVHKVPLAQIKRGRLEVEF